MGMFLYLHSTMYLLKLNFFCKILHKNIFTFHHVSIKTRETFYKKGGEKKFTFHHVSIKTHIIIILELPLLFNVILSTS